MNEWDKIYGRDPQYIPSVFYRKIADLYPLTGDVLALGCGVVNVFHDATVTGMDISQAALDKCNHPQAVCADVDNGLPFADNSFDAVTMFLLINYLHNREFVLSEVARVLRPEGKVFILGSVGAGYKNLIVNEFAVDDVCSLMEQFSVETIKLKRESKEVDIIIGRI